MDSDSLIMLLFMVLLTALSGFFSATETAFSSFNRIRMKSLASSGNRKASLVLKLDENYDRLITAILIGNNIVNITLTTVSTLFFMKVLTSLSEDVVATLSTVIVTVVVLVFGEVTPKALSKDHADGYALSTCSLIRGFVTVMSPLTILFSFWKKLIGRVFKTAQTDVTTEDDLITMVEEAEHGGGLDEDESELIRSAIEFSDLTAGEILTPRIDIVAVHEGTDPREIMMMFFDTGYSRLPVVGDTIDDVKGVLHEKDFYYAYNTGKTDLSEYYQKPLYVSKHLRIDDLLRTLQSEQCHMAFVIDEFGGLMGIVTMEDIIEELIGDVWDEHDEVENLFVKNNDGSYNVDCSADLDDLFDLFDLEYDDDDSEKPQTVNGWLQLRFEGMPVEGDTLSCDGLDIKVLKCDEKMVREIVARKTPDKEDIGSSDDKNGDKKDRSGGGAADADSDHADDN